MSGPDLIGSPGLHRVSENRLMNRRFCVWVGSILGFFSLAAFTSGQDSPVDSSIAPAASAGSSIPPAALAAPSEAPYAAAINGFITEQLTALSGTDFPAQTAARDKLKGALTRGDTPAYYSTFAKDWTAGCASILAKSPALGVRLNIAIVTATLADNGETLDALPIVIQLLNDREPCVELWAIKASRSLVQILAETQSPRTVSTSPLLPAIVKAVKNCGKSDVSGFATADAYSALAVSIPGKTEAEMKPLRTPLVRFVLDEVEFRISQHAAGLVQSPGAERYIATWLSGTYPDLATLPREQLRIVQLLVTLETYVGQRSDLYQYDKKATAQIHEMLKYVTSALKVIGGAPVGNRLDWLTSVPPAARPADIFAHTKELFGTMQLAFHELTPPPAIAVIAPPPPPPAPVTTAKPAAAPVAP
jgi:hypothetical protein